MSRLRHAAIFTLLFAAACNDSTLPTAAARLATASPLASMNVAAAEPSGERFKGSTALIPIFESTSGIIYGSTPTGPALWPANPNQNAQGTFYLVVYPVTSTVGQLQCMDVPQETCPDHGPVIAGGAMQIYPPVYGAGVLGHDHLSQGHGGPGFHVTEYPILVLFTNAAAANHRLTTKADVDAAVATGQVFLFEVPSFSFHNSIINAAMYNNATPWVCPAYTLCPAP
jgi:hypothetical protein